MRSILLSAVVLIVIAGRGAFDSARAAALAFDSAADPAYAPYFSSAFLPNGINGGYGWGSGWEGAAGPNNLDLRVVSTAGSTINSPYTSGGSVWILPLFSGDMCFRRLVCDGRRSRWTARLRLPQYFRMNWDRRRLAVSMIAEFLICCVGPELQQNGAPNSFRRQNFLENSRIFT